MAKFDDFTRALVLNAYLVEGKSHREIQREILKLPAPARGGGFESMIILHEYGIKGRHKSVFKYRSVFDTDIDKSAIDLLAEFLMLEKEVDDLLENNLNPDNKDTERESKIRARLFQKKLKDKLVHNYNHECAVCAINKFDLLVCSHIIPWASDVSKRLDLQNVICLCFLHDKLFDKGYWTLSDTYEIILSKRVDKNLVGFFNGNKFKWPKKFGPSVAFLRFHRAKIFK